MSTRSDHVKKQIEEAFSGVPHPGDDAIVRGRDWESLELSASFRGKHWKEIPAETLRRHHDDLALFSPSGLQFYLPAYLLAAMRDDWDILCFVLLHLQPPPKDREPDRWGSFLSRFARFTPAQKHAIRAFLEFVRDELPGRCCPPEEISSTLDLFWGQE